MTVAHLIQWLSRFDPNAPVSVHITEGEGMVKPLRSVETDPALQGSMVYLIAYEGPQMPEDSYIDGSVL